MMSESNSAAPESTEQSGGGSALSHANLTKLVSEYEAFDQNKGGTGELHKFAQTISGSGQVPGSLYRSFEEYAIRQLLENPNKYGISLSGNLSQKKDQAKKILSDNKSKFERGLREMPAWQATLHKKNAHDLSDQLQEDFGLSGSELGKVRQNLEKKDPYFIKGLLGSNGKRRIYLEGLLKRKFASQNLGDFGKVLEFIKEKNFGSKDANILAGLAELEKLAADASSVDAQKIATLLQANSLSDSQLKTVLQKLLPTVSLEEVYSANTQLFESLFQAYSAPVENTYGLDADQNLSIKQRVTTTEVGKLPISTRSLPANLQRSLLAALGGRRIVHNVTSNVSPDGFSFQEGIREFNEFYEDGDISTGSKKAHEILEEEYELSDGNTATRSSQKKLAEALGEWNKTQKNISGLAHMKEGAIIRARGRIGSEPVDFFYRIKSLPQQSVTEDEDGGPSVHPCRIEVLGNSKHGVQPNSNVVYEKNYREMFFFLTKEADSVEFIQDNGGPNSPWKVYQESHSIREHGDFSATSEFEHDRFEQRVQQVINDPRCKMRAGTTISAKNGDGQEIWLLIKDYNPTNGNIVLDQGFTDSHGERYISWTFAQFLNFAEQANGLKYIADAEPNGQSVLDTLKLDKDTKGVFGDLTIKDGRLYSGDAENPDTRQHIEVIQASGKGKDLYIHSIHGNEVEITMGKFTPHILPDSATGKKFTPPKFNPVKGSHQKIHIQALIGYFKQNKPKQAYPVVTQCEEEEQIPEVKAGFWNGILALKRLGAIPFAFKKPFEAIKAEWERDMEVFGNQAAYLFLERVPLIKRFDWNTTLMANTSRSIKTQLEQAVEEVGGAYSSRRQDIIYKWGTKHKMPHFKFIAAMMASLAEYGGFYYTANSKRLPPYFWIQKLLWPERKPSADWPSDDDFNSRMLQGLLKQAAGLPNDAPDITREEFGSINEIHMTQIAFVKIQKRYPQYTNFYRMCDKFVKKGHDGGVGGGPPNLAARPDKAGRLAWLMEAIEVERVNERIPAIKELWFKDQVGYEGYEYGLPIYALITSNRITAAPKETVDLFKDMGKTAGIHIPAFFFLENARELVTLRKAMVQVAYVISPEAGEIMQNLIESTNYHPARGSQGKTNAYKGLGKEHAQKLEAFWREYGKEFTDLMGATKNPAALGLSIAEQAGKEKVPPEPGELSAFGNLDDSYQQSFHTYYSTLQQKLDIESTMQYRGTSYDQDFFRFSHDIGFPVFFAADCYTYFDKNVDNRPYWQGDNPYAGDGIWNEFRKAVQNIPNAAQDMVEKYEESTGKKLSMSRKKELQSKYAFAIYNRVRMGPGGQSGAYTWLKGQENYSLKATYWSNDALIYGFIGPKENGATESNILEKFGEWKRLHDLYGKEGKYRLGDLGKGEMVNGEIVREDNGRKSVGTTIESVQESVAEKVYDLTSGDARTQIGQILGKKDQETGATSQSESQTPNYDHVDQARLDKLQDHNYLRVILGLRPKMLDGGKLKEVDESAFDERMRDRRSLDRENLLDEESSNQEGD